ncbi:MAG: hypothetical protein HUU41_22790 [Bryobacteraceae bacterium]|nr:hypothetical protein [Bryobacterales bacterium]NUN03942.1 hypothetical protein [Bryobacteraceae bacterium]
MRFRTIFTAGGAVCVIALSFAVTKRLRSQQILSSRMRPYTINIYERSTTLAKPALPVVERRSFKARRSDGSTVEGTLTKMRTTPSHQLVRSA